MLYCVVRLGGAYAIITQGCYAVLYCLFVEGGGGCIDRLDRLFIQNIYYIHLHSRYNSNIIVHKF